MGCYQTINEMIKTKLIINKLEEIVMSDASPGLRTLLDDLEEILANASTFLFRRGWAISGIFSDEIRGSIVDDIRLSIMPKDTGRQSGLRMSYDRLP